MIITDGIYLLVSRHSAEKSGILYSQCLAESEPILAMAVDSNSVKLGEQFSYEWEDKSSQFSIGVSEFASEAKSLGLEQSAMVALVPDGAFVYQGPITKADGSPTTKKWRCDRIDNKKFVVVFDDGVVVITDNIHPAVDPTATAVITQYSMYAHQNPQLPKTYDLFSAQTGELIHNASL